MADVFREVDEDLRRDQLKKVWQRWAPYVYGVAILIVVSVAGYKVWEYIRVTEAQSTGDRFVTALELSASGDHEEAIASFESIVQSGSGGYPMLARLGIASDKAANGDVVGAIDEYDAIAADSAAPDAIRNIATLRAAMLVVDKVDFSDLQRRIDHLAEVGSAWRHIARELLGLGAWRAGDIAAAREYFEEINSDQDTPQDMRSRSQLMLQLIAASGAPDAATEN